MRARAPKERCRCRTRERQGAVEARPTALRKVSSRIEVNGDIQERTPLV